MKPPSQYHIPFPPPGHRARRVPPRHRARRVIVGSLLLLAALLCRSLPNNLLIRKPLVTIREVNNAAIRETIFLQQMTHDQVIPMSIYPDIGIATETEIHNLTEDTMHISITRHTMDNMITPIIIQPTATVDPPIRGLRRRQQRKVTHYAPIILYNKPATHLNIPQHHRLRRVPIHPLMHVTRTAHNTPSSIHDQHNISQIRQPRRSHNPIHHITISFICQLLFVNC